ncbi:MAG: hypothetical protein U1F37_22605 [Alphaproteobacteria bacterium]
MPDTAGRDGGLPRVEADFRAFAGVFARVFAGALAAARAFVEARRFVAAAGFLAPRAAVFFADDVFETPRFALRDDGAALPPPRFLVLLAVACLP